MWVILAIQAEKIDLIVSMDNKHKLALEIKLTVVPDHSTQGKTEDEWAPELVIRPVSSAYAMMGVASALLESENKSLKIQVIELLKPVYNKISNWDNDVEIQKNSEDLRECLLKALHVMRPIQKAFLIQPIWKTQGQSFVLHNNCFDVFVWTDVALMMLPAVLCDPNKMSRHLREIARHVRALYNLLSTGDFNYNGIYGGMPLNNQTDKSFAISGNKSYDFLQHDRLERPILKKSVLDEIILNNGVNQLKPERRFDAAVFNHFSKN